MVSRTNKVASYCFTDFLTSTVLLSCGLHTCPSKCHQIFDHSKTACRAAVKSTCPSGHSTQRPCSDSGKACSTCEREKREKERKDRADLDHAVRIAELEENIAKEREKVKRRRDADDRAKALDQKEDDLRLAKAATVAFEAQASASLPRQTAKKSSTPSSNGVPAISSSPLPVPEATSGSHVDGTGIETPNEVSSARARWEQQKLATNESNDALDEIMSMTGLEKVKEQVLAIKDKKDIATLQGADLSKERFNVAMLGNPGTGTLLSRAFVNYSNASCRKDNCRSPVCKVPDLLPNSSGYSVYRIDWLSTRLRWSPSR